MKKLLKQLLAVTTAIMMAITLLPAMANAEEVEPTAPTKTIDYTRKGKLTINKTTGKKVALPGAEFTIYKIASLNEEEGYQMIIKADGYATPDSLLNLNTDVQMAAAAKFKKAVDTNAKKEDTDTTKAPVWSMAQPTDDKGEAVFDNLDLGYYLVVETKTPETPEAGKPNGKTQYVASAPFFVAIPTSNTTSGPTDEMTDTTTTSWVYDVTAKPKNEEVGIDKKIVEKNETNKEKDTVAVGDTINYEITSTSPKYTKEYFKSGGADNDPTYKIHDILSDGLTLNANTIKVTVDGTELNPTTDYSLTTEAHKFDIEFTVDFLKEYKGATVKVNYSVTVNENAVVGTDGNTNDVSLDYSRKPDDPTTGVPGKTTPKVYTYALRVNKKDGASTDKGLAGAKFQLYKKGTETPIAGLKDMVNKDGNENGVKDTLVTLEDGVIEFSGLNVGTYVLREIEAPKGYTLNKDEIEFTIGDEDTDGKLDSVAEGSKVTNVTTEDGKNTGMVETTITNNKGFNLPSTGGMGTYIFTIGGLVVMAGAVLLLVSSKKKRA